jgi:hypothetical protein
MNQHLRRVSICGALLWRRRHDKVRMAACLADARYYRGAA